MQDIYFAYGMGVLLVLVVVLYGIRLVTRGAARSDRVGQIGGTALVSQGVMETTYWALDPFVRVFVALRFTPNMVTWSALFFGIAAGVAVAFGWFGLCCVLGVWSTFLDILDGQVARATKTSSNSGELLDAAIDRYTEFALVGGLIVFLRNSVPLMCLALAALLACFMVSYASAKAEALQVKAPRGLMRRHERATYILTAAGFTPLLGPWLHAQWDVLPWYSLEVIALAVVAVVGNFAAIQRFVRIGRALR